MSFNINNCSIIENTIKESKKVRENLKNCNLKYIDKIIILEGNEINLFNELIKSFGNINLKKYFNSNIQFDQKSVKYWLNNREFTSELLFRKTRDGSTSDDFHKHCDNQGITITFIETTKGYKFGGYTEKEWDKNGWYKTDINMFIFSLNNNIKYTAKNNKGSIKGDKDYGPFFGNGFPEIVFYTSLNRGRTWDEPSENIFFSGRKLTNGEEYWDVKEIEVFKIIYK